MCVFIKLHKNSEKRQHRARSRRSSHRVGLPGLRKYQQTETRLGLASHHRLCQSHENWYSQGDRNWRADRCGRAYIGGGISRRDTRS